jgi:hypothetical protein
MSSANQGEGSYVPPVRGRNMFPAFRVRRCAHMYSANQRKGTGIILPIRAREYVSANQGEGISVFRELERGICFRHSG